MKTTSFWRYSALALVLTAFGACSVDNNSSSVETETLNDESLTERFSINVETDPGVLASRIINRNETVGAKIKRDGIVILDTTGVVVESQILPPNEDTAPNTENIMSATHITRANNTVYVTYHSNNEDDFEGGLQALGINEGTNTLSLGTEATTGDFEWNHAYVDGNTIWVAGDADRGASLFAIDATDNGSIADTDSASVVKLFGPSANATIGIGGDIYVSVGGANDADSVLGDGRGQVGVYKLNADVTNDDFADEEAGLGISPFSRLKHLAVDNGDLVALRINGSGDAELVRFDANLSPTTVTLSGAALNDAEITPVDGKNGLYVASNTVAYIAAGDAGVISVNPTSGVVIDQIDFNGENEFGNPELGSTVNAVWGDANYLYVSASSAFVIIPIDTGGDILEEQAKRIPLSYLVGDVNGDNVKNLDDIEAAQANVNYAFPISSNANNAEVLVAIGRAGVVYLNIDM